MTSEPRCWLCSRQIEPTERSKTLADLDVLVHATCSNELFEAHGPRPWSSEPPSEEPDK